MKEFELKNTLTLWQLLEFQNFWSKFSWAHICAKSSFYNNDKSRDFLNILKYP